MRRKRGQRMLEVGDIDGVVVAAFRMLLTVAVVRMIVRLVVVEGRDSHF